MSKEFTEEQIKKANEEISNLLGEAHAKISEAEKIADDYKLDFTFSVAYGMGGWYEPKGYPISKYDADYENENSVTLEGKWCPSSHSC